MRRIVERARKRSARIPETCASARLSAASSVAVPAARSGAAIERR